MYLSIGDQSIQGRNKVKLIKCREEYKQKPQPPASRSGWSDNEWHGRLRTWQTKALLKPYFPSSNHLCCPLIKRKCQRWYMRTFLYIFVHKWRWVPSDTYLYSRVCYCGRCSAVDLGTDMLELDCHLTKDEEVVVSHDQNLQRSTGINAYISDMAYAVSKGR